MMKANGIRYLRIRKLTTNKVKGRFHVQAINLIYTRLLLLKNALGRRKYSTKFKLWPMTEGKTSNRGGKDRLRNTLSKLREYQLCLGLKFDKDREGFPRNLMRLPSYFLRTFRTCQGMQQSIMPSRRVLSHSA